MIKKRSYFWKLPVIITFLLTFMVITGCSSASPDLAKINSSTDTAEADSSTDLEKIASSFQDNNMLRSNTDGVVSINVEYLGYKDNLLSFNIAMDTHSVDLDQYDLTQLSVLMDDKGNSYPPFSWDAEPGGHHRTGILTFSQSGSQDKPDILKLIISNVAEIQERTFTWENIPPNF